MADLGFFISDLCLDSFSLSFLALVKAGAFLRKHRSTRLGNFKLRLLICLSSNDGRIGRKIRFICVFTLNDDTHSKRGRPKTSLIDRLRVVVWSHHVMAASGVHTAEEFELRYERPTGKVKLSRGLWSRYLRGETVPQGAVAGSARSLIDRLDIQYPGTSDIFLHPVWALLDFEHLLGPDQLREKYLCLNEDIWTQFVACVEKTKPNEPSEPLAFWPLTQSEAARKMRLGRLSGLDGLAVCLIEARMGYLSQTEERFVSSLVLAGQHFQELSKEDVFSSTRMRSTLLVMESHCVAFVTEKTISAPPGNEAHSELRSIAKRWQLDWIKRCEVHLKKLSPSSNKALRSWLKLALGENANQLNQLK